MSLHPEPSLEELLWTVAAARIVLGPAMNVQAPPNLTPPSEQLQQVGSAGSSETIRASEEEAQVAGLRQGWRALLDAGINDWGGSVGRELGRRIVGLGSGHPCLRPTPPQANPSCGVLLCPCPLLAHCPFKSRTRVQVASRP